MIFSDFSMNINVSIYFMVNSSYVYLLLCILGSIALLYFVFNFKTNKNQINNKILLRNLLESFDLDLPEELKRMDNSSADTQKLS